MDLKRNKFNFQFWDTLRMSFIRTESIEIRKRNVTSEKTDSADPPDYILIKEMTFQRTSLVTSVDIRDGDVVTNHLILVTGSQILVTFRDFAAEHFYDVTSLMQHFLETNQIVTNMFLSAKFVTNITVTKCSAAKSLNVTKI